MSERISDLAVIEYTVPLRISFDSRGDKTVERDVREHQERDDYDCIQEPSSCSVSGMRDEFLRTRRSDFRHKGEPGVLYFFPDLRGCRVSILISPERYDVHVADDPYAGCRCGGLIYHDGHRIIRPLLDLARADAHLREGTLELLLPRIR